MKLGIIGGMGPMATVYFMELIVNMTEASCDSEHLEMVVYNCPSIPDRTKYILGKSEENPLPKMMELAALLKQQEVRCVAIPCMTAHYFYDEISKSELPIIHGLRETALELKRAGVKVAGLMATDGTISSGIFQRILEENGIKVIIPDAVFQEKIMSLIYDDIKAGTMPAYEKIEEIKNYLVKTEGAQAVILGCTELSLLKKKYDLGAGVIDTLDVLAKKSLEMCGKKINKKYEKIFIPIEE